VPPQLSFAAASLFITGGLHGDRFHGVQYALAQLEAAAIQADTATAATHEGTDFLLTVMEECMYAGLNDVNHKAVTYILFRLRHAERAALAGSHRSSRVKVKSGLTKVFRLRATAALLRVIQVSLRGA
jgi:hypothetical protein